MRCFGSSFPAMALGLVLLLAGTLTKAEPHAVAQRPAATAATAVTAPAAATDSPVFQAQITRKGVNLYQIDSTDLWAVTVGCSLQAYAEEALIRPGAAGSQGELLIVYSKDRCALRGVFGPLPPLQGVHPVRVSLKADNWYEIFGTNTFVRTHACRVMVLAEEATLVYAGDGRGQLRFQDGSNCKIEGRFGKRRF